MPRDGKRGSGKYQETKKSGTDHCLRPVRREKRKKDEMEQGSSEWATTKRRGLMPERKGVDVAVAMRNFFIGNGGNHPNTARIIPGKLGGGAIFAKGTT